MKLSRLSDWLDQWEGKLFMCEFSSCAEALASLKPQNGVKKLLKLHWIFCTMQRLMRKETDKRFSLFLHTIVELDFALYISFTFWIHSNKFLDQRFAKALFYVLWSMQVLKNMILILKRTKPFVSFISDMTYSRVHISSDTAFLKIVKKPSIVQE